MLIFSADVLDPLGLNGLTRLRYCWCPELCVPYPQQGSGPAGGVLHLPPVPPLSGGPGRLPANLPKGRCTLFCSSYIKIYREFHI